MAVRKTSRQTKSKVAKRKPAKVSRKKPRAKTTTSKASKERKTQAKNGKRVKKTNGNGITKATVGHADVNEILSRLTENLTTPKKAVRKNLESRPPAELPIPTSTFFF